MVYVTLFLNVLLMLFMPVAIAQFISAKRKPSWGLFGMGAVTFIASQLAHIPFNWLILQRFQLISSDVSVFSNLVVLAVFLGLSAGLFEESARFLTYKYWAKDARSWGRGLMLGAGHGGIEAIILGTLLGVNYFVLARMQSGALLDLIPDGQLPIVEAQIDAVFSSEWYIILLGSLERLFAICFHLSASLLVMTAVSSGKIRWLVGAVLWHSLLDAIAVFAVVTWNAYVAEAMIGIMAIISLIVVFILRSPEPEARRMEPLEDQLPLRPAKIEWSEENLDKSRYL